MLKEEGITDFNGRLPDVRRLSDILFVEWQDQAKRFNLDVKELKWVLRYDIRNDMTRSVIYAVSWRQPKEEQSLLWPGIIVPGCSDDGKALLGTPNGVGVGWLLASHKKQLGQKTIESVRIWVTIKNNVETFNALFKIMPVSEAGPSCQR
jgi:hypothetical protein